MQIYYGSSDYIWITLIHKIEETALPKENDKGFLFPRFEITCIGKETSSTLLDQIKKLCLNDFQRKYPHIFAQYLRSLMSSSSHMLPQLIPFYHYKTKSVF